MQRCGTAAVDTNDHKVQRKIRPMRQFGGFGEILAGTETCLGETRRHLSQETLRHSRFHRDIVATARDAKRSSDHVGDLQIPKATTQTPTGQHFRPRFDHVSFKDNHRNHKKGGSKRPKPRLVQEAWRLQTEDPNVHRFLLPSPSAANLGISSYGTSLLPLRRQTKGPVFQTARRSALHGRVCAAGQTKPSGNSQTPPLKDAQRVLKGVKKFFTSHHWARHTCESIYEHMKTHGTEKSTKNTRAMAT